MTPEQFQAVVEILKPHMTSPAEREALLNMALFAHPVLNNIDTTGAPGVCVPRMVRTLQAADNGIQLIITVLQTLKKQVGGNKARDIDALIAQLRHAPAMQDELPPQKPDKTLSPAEQEMIDLLKKRIHDKQMQILALDEDYDAQRIQRHAWQSQRAECDAQIKQYQQQINDILR